MNNAAKTNELNGPATAPTELGAAKTPSLKSVALRSLAARERSRAELQAKLMAQPGADANQVQTVLDELQAKGYQSDERTAQALLHRRAGKLGSQRLMHELRQRGVDADALSQAQQSLQSTELDRATAVWQKKFGAAPANAADRAKHMRFMASRGFGMGIIQRVLRQAGDADD
jgi:regulatory protein